MSIQSKTQPLYVVTTSSSRKSRVSSSLPESSTAILELRRGKVEMMTTINLILAKNQKMAHDLIAVRNSSLSYCDFGNAIRLLLLWQP